MFNPGLIEPVNEGITGLETKTRNLRPLVFCVEFELPPHETRHTTNKMETKRALKVLFNPGTPKNIAG
jgi:hypothetical protein